MRLAAGAIIAYNANASVVGGIFNCWVALFAPGDTSFLPLKLQHPAVPLSDPKMVMFSCTENLCAAGVILIFGFMPW